MTLDTLERITIASFLSGLICLVMYLSTAIIIYYLDGINIHEEPVGALAILLYFIVPFIMIIALKVDKDD